MNAVEDFATKEAGTLKAWLMAHWYSFGGGIVIGAVAGWIIGKL